MAAPLTQYQLPLDAILDIFGKQTYLGNSFTLPSAGVALSNTSETELAVITNPAGSGKSLFLFSRTATTNNNPVIFNYYKNCTINSAGSATAAVNLRTGATTASISVCYLGATITSNGTLMRVIASAVYSVLSDVLLIVDPGTNILITGTQVGSGTTTAIPGTAWYEL